MKDVNKMILLGRLGADPVQRETKTGKVVVQFPIATNRRTRDEASEDETGIKEETQWHRVVAWGKQGEACAHYLKKGQPVYVEGSIKSRKYESKEGEQRYSVEVHADNVVFLSGKPAAIEAAEALAQ